MLKALLQPPTYRLEPAQQHALAATKPNAHTRVNFCIDSTRNQVQLVMIEDEVERPGQA
jgi:hypothetical protein